MKFKDFWNLFILKNIKEVFFFFFPRTQHSVVVSSFQLVLLPDFSWTVTLGPLIYKWAFLHWGQVAEDPFLLFVKEALCFIIGCLFIRFPTHMKGASHRAVRALAASHQWTSLRNLVGPLFNQAAIWRTPNGLDENCFALLLRFVR